MTAMGSWDGTRWLAVLLLAVSMPVSAQHQFSAEDGTPSLLVLGFLHADFAENDLDGHHGHNKHGGDADAEEEGFREARLALHLSASLSPTWSAFAEMELSVFDDDTRESVERFFVKYAYSDAISFSAGRFHTPLGYWNAHYHHGRWLQTTVDRPLLWEFGSALQPAHFWGVQAEGKIPIGSVDLEYVGGVGAGRAESVKSPAFSAPIDGDRAYFVNLGLRPHANRNLNFGISLWTEDLEIPGLPDVDEQIVSLYFATRGEQPEVLAEWVRVEHDLPTGSVDHDAFYVQLGYRLDAHEGKLKPYGRIEEVDIDAADPVYAGLDGAAKRGMVGLRYDFHPKAAWKVELRRDDPDIGDSFNVLQTQIAVVF